MPRLTADKSFIHPDCPITSSIFGAYVEIGQGSRVAHSTVGDYSYCDRYADIANAQIGKFSNIAAFSRVGATDHSLDTAACHHFLYRSDDNWDDADRDAAFFAHRQSRVAHIGHDTWIVAGTPATKLRDRQPAKIAERLMGLAWWDWTHDALRSALTDFRSLSAEAFLEKYA